MSCHDQSCGSHSQGCGCSCHSCTCCSESHDSHHDSHESCCDKAQKLLAVADAAWLEALKEKIKQNILASDHQIDEIAKIIGETNRDLWHQKMARAQTEENYGSRLNEVMSKISCCSSDKKNYD